MSGEVVGWAMKQITGSPVSKLVLVKLADNSNEEGVCWPSVGLLVKHTELSERAVREHLRILELKGFIRVIPRKTDADRNRSNVYRMMMGGQEVHPAGGAGGGGTTPGEPAPPAPSMGAPGAGRTLTKKNRQNRQMNPASGDAAIKEGLEKRKHLIADYVPGDDAKGRAIKYWSARDRTDLVEAVDDQVDRFLAHHRGNGSRMADWDSVWQTWYCNAVQYTKPPQGFKSKEVAFEDCGHRSWIKRLEVFNGKTDSPKGTWSQKWGPMPGKPGCKVPPAAEAAFNRGERE